MSCHVMSKYGFQNMIPFSLKSICGALILRENVALPQISHLTVRVMSEKKQVFVKFKSILEKSEYCDIGKDADLLEMIASHGIVLYQACFNTLEEFALDPQSALVAGFTGKVRLLQFMLEHDYSRIQTLEKLKPAVCVHCGDRYVDCSKIYSRMKLLKAAVCGSNMGMHIECQNVCWTFMQEHDMAKGQDTIMAYLR